MKIDKENFPWFLNDGPNTGESDQTNRLDNIRLLQLLQKPKNRVDVVLDTDAYNEIDDQYALAYLIRSNEKLNLKAIYAAPFSNYKCENPQMGMEKSYEEIHRILDLMGENKTRQIVYKGSCSYLPDENRVIDSPAARHLACLAMEYNDKNPLYVVAIAAATNIASALLMQPEIRNRIVVIWLGGHAHNWHDNMEFNLTQDIAAARILFGCGVPLVQLPCRGVVSAFTTTGPELTYWLSDKNALCDYLLKTTLAAAAIENAAVCWSRPLWDVAAVGWLLNENFTLDHYTHSPIPEYDNFYSFSPVRHLIRCVYHINRDDLMHDLFLALSRPL